MTSQIWDSPPASQSCRTILLVLSFSIHSLLLAAPIPELPLQALEGPGCWQVGDFLFATGTTGEIRAVGEAKGGKLEEKLALEDAKRRVGVFVALSLDRNFDDSTYEIEAIFRGFQARKTFRTSDGSPLLLVGSIPVSDVSVKARFSPSRARKAAFDAFAARRFSEASRRFAELTRRGIQDEETVAWARAAGYRVNLEKEVNVEEALWELGLFHESTGENEEALQLLHRLYEIETTPEKNLLHHLRKLCLATGRKTTAARFSEEIKRMFGDDQQGESDLTALQGVKELSVSPPFDRVLARCPKLLEEGGAAIVKAVGATFFLAVGSTDVYGTSPSERLRQIKVARVRAEKAAVAFTHEARVTVRDQIVTVSRAGESRMQKQVSEETLEQLSGGIAEMKEVGSWVSQDGSEFFLATACELAKE